MRIRRKKNLGQRLENVSDYLLVTDKKLINVNEALENKNYIDYKKVFRTDILPELEVGCGKGGFITELALLRPEKNFLAVELIDNVIVSAAENVKKSGINNVKFLNTGAEYLARYIPPHSIENIYLNFSPPFPQKTHENRRLTNDKRINDYKSFLVNGGQIFLKTDDKGFFDYSAERLTSNGFEVKTYAQKDSGQDFLDVLTEYEKKFTEQGVKIYKLSAKIK